LINMIGIWPSLIINVAAPYIIGAFIADWIGSKRNYHLPRPWSILVGIVALIGLFAVLFASYEYPTVHTATTVTSTIANGG
jgi:membrane associated rhomboid family serine protease